ncbi:hypothetical protein [Shewanella salipaludis]|uniref:Uncharacterized protein n=1 Tax=Shewanella salipaludis TaxID=2723052 RepID=A0A972FSI2_9GAMM|nr:hypothetical protein [Shewanella salipaludis]NMH64916.1 hypothetical protein [Shewanella salipaludis]
MKKAAGVKHDALEPMAGKASTKADEPPYSGSIADAKPDNFLSRRCFVTLDAQI